MNALRRRDAGYMRDQQAAPAMTPMVDVTLVILIFFMASAVIGGREWFLEAAIASADVAGEEVLAELPEPLFVVKVVPGTGGGLAEGFGLGMLSVEAFAEVLPNVLEGVEAGDLRVVIEPLPGARYGDVVRVREVLDANGVRDVGLR